MPTSKHLTISLRGTDSATPSTDNRPPFNGTDSHDLKQYFKWAGIKHKPILSAEDPVANGLAESFMKHCQKVWHTSYVGGKNPAAELNKHLRMYRATPDPTTGKSPSEVLFGRTIRTQIPNLETQPSDKF